MTALGVSPGVAAITCPAVAGSQQWTWCSPWKISSLSRSGQSHAHIHINIEARIWKKGQERKKRFGWGGGCLLLPQVEVEQLDLVSTPPINLNLKLTEALCTASDYIATPTRTDVTQRFNSARNRTRTTTIHDLPKMTMFFHVSWTDARGELIGLNWFLPGWQRLW